MIVMRPIREDAVIAELSKGRFPGNLDGYVVMDTEQMTYLGHALFRVDGAVTEVLDCDVENTALVDGAVRACVAAGEDRGATSFSVNTAHAVLAQWTKIFVKEDQFPVPNDKIFKQCK